jgi:hypothetical protein
MSICRLLGYITDDDGAAGRFVSMNGGWERKNSVKLLALDNYRNEIRETKNIKRNGLGLSMCTHTHVYRGGLLFYFLTQLIAVWLPASVWRMYYRENITGPELGFHTTG